MQRRTKGVSRVILKFLEDFHSNKKSALPVETDNNIYGIAIMY